MQELTHSNAGFTLIEALIYIGLLGIMIGGGVVGVYNILEGSGRTREAMYREQDAYFITRKIDTVLSRAESVVTAGDCQLRVQTADELVCFNAADEIIYMQTEDNDPVPLNDVFIPATSLSAEINEASSTVTVNFTLDEHEYTVSHYMP